MPDMRATPMRCQSIPFPKRPLHGEVHEFLHGEHSQVVMLMDIAVCVLGVKLPSYAHVLHGDGEVGSDAAWIYVDWVSAAIQKCCQGGLLRDSTWSHQGTTFCGSACLRVWQRHKVHLAALFGVSFSRFEGESDHWRLRPARRWCLRAEAKALRGRSHLAKGET